MNAVDSESPESAATDLPEACPDRVHEAATWQCKSMFAVALAFLLLIGFSLHYSNSDQMVQSSLLTWLLIGLWSIIFVESIVGYWRTADFSWSAALPLLVIWLFPPYRVALATYPVGRCVWLPILGWQKADRYLFDRLDRGFSIPMLFIALLIIPILIIEQFAASHVPDNPSLELLLDAGTSVIWLAFAFEFILMSAIADKKFRYIGKNWINLAIILLPFIAFLRGFRFVRVARVGKAAKVLKAYRLRGLGMRAWRGVVTLELIEMLLFRKPESRLARLRAKLRDHEHDMEVLRNRIRILESEVEGRAADDEGGGRS